MADGDRYRGLDLNIPSPARVYDYFLGGSHNFAPDRELARRLATAMPNIGEVMRANRAFLLRAVEFLVDAGIRQFLDLGSGVPTVGNVHEIAQRQVPETRVVYVDIDPVAVAHSEEILTGNPYATVIQADLLEPADVLSRPEPRKLLDLDRPLAVLLVGVLHQFPGDGPLLAIRRYREAMVPGSYLGLSAATSDGRDQRAVRTYKATYDKGYGPGTDMTYRSRSETQEFFDGFEIVAPGLVSMTQWRPDLSDPLDPADDAGTTYAYGAVGRRVGS